jgi:hypothetical protein
MQLKFAQMVTPHSARFPLAKVELKPVEIQMSRPGAKNPPALIL